MEIIIKQDLCQGSLACESDRVCAGLFNMGIPHITHIKLIWGKKIIKYGISLKINQK